MDPESEDQITKYPKSGDQIPNYKAYGRKTFDADIDTYVDSDTDEVVTVVPDPKQYADEEAESIQYWLRTKEAEKWVEIQGAEMRRRGISEGLDYLARSLASAEEDNRTKVAAIAELNVQLSKLKESAENTLSELQGLKNQLEELEKDKAAAQTENNELNGQIVKLKADIGTKTNEFNELGQKYQAALDQIEQLNKNIAQNNAAIEKYEKQLGTANNELTRTKADLVKLQEELKQIIKAGVELQANYNKSIEDNKILQKNFAVVSYDKKGLQTQLDTVSKALQTERTKYDDLEAKYKNLDESYSGLKNDYRVVKGKNEKNEQENATLREQLTRADLEKGVLKTSNELLNDRVVVLVNNVKGLKANEKLSKEVINDLKRQAGENEGLRNQLVQVTGERDNALFNRDQYAIEAVQQANAVWQQQEKEKINKLEKDQKAALSKLNSDLDVLQSKLDVANNAKLLALNAQQIKHIANIDKINSENAAKLANLQKTLFEQEALRKAAVEDKIAVEKEIKAQISEKEKLIDQLKQKKDELKDVQTALKNLKDKFGEQDFLQKQIANFEEKKIELQNEIKVHKDNLSKLKKADKQLDSSPPSGFDFFDFFGPAPARKSRSRQTNANNFFPPPSYSFPPPSYYSPPPPPPSNNFFPSPSYYNPPPPPNYNPAPPSYLPKWPGDSNKLTLEIKVAGGEGGTRAGLDSNLSPVSRPKGDIISKLPFGPYGIEIFQPERFRKMDTKQDKKKGKKQPTPYQIARSVGKSLFRNLDPLRIRKTSVGTDTTYHALERTPAMFETFGRSTKRRKVTRIY